MRFRECEAPAEPRAPWPPRCRSAGASHSRDRRAGPNVAAAASSPESSMFRKWFLSLRSLLLLVLAALASGRATGAVADEAGPGRPPAVPLVACDPYFSVWSCADRLTDDVTRHWTGKKQALSSLIRVDGKAYR